MALSGQAAKTRAPRKPRPWRHLYAQLVAVTAVLFVVQFVVARHAIVEPLVKQLDDLQKKRLDIYLDLVKLLLTASGVSLGAITGFVLNRDKSIVFTREQLRKVVASWILCGISILCGYWTIEEVVWMLTNNFFDFYQLQIWLPSRGQFLTLLAAIAVFADFIYTSLNTREKTHE